MVGRLRAYVGERRRAPRRQLRLSCSVALFDPVAHAASAPPAAQLDGYTRDLSATGLAFVLPAVRVGGRYLTGPDVILHVQLAHPAGPLTLLATPVRYEQLAKDGAEQGYLIGVHIREMSAADRAQYEAHLAQPQS